MIFEIGAKRQSPVNTIADTTSRNHGRPIGNVDPVPGATKAGDAAEAHGNVNGPRRLYDRKRE